MGQEGEEAVKKIWVVMGRTGEYEDYREWPVLGFTDEEQAREYAANATTAAKGICERAREHEDGLYDAHTRDPNPLDPDMEDCQSDYYAMPVVMAGGAKKGRKG
jgi:hypothetical protein